MGMVATATHDIICRWYLDFHVGSNVSLTVFLLSGDHCDRNYYSYHMAFADFWLLSAFGLTWDSGLRTQSVLDLDFLLWQEGNRQKIAKPQSPIVTHNCEVSCGTVYCQAVTHDFG